MARYFDGVDDYIAVPVTSDMTPQDFTLMLWAYVMPNSYTYPDLLRQALGFKTGFVFRWSHNDNYLQLRRDVYRKSDGAFVAIVVSDTQQNFAYLNAWHHYCAVFSQTNGWARLYVDGNLRNAITFDPSQYNFTWEADEFWVMTAYYGGAGLWMRGYACEVKFFNRALSQEEIRQEMRRRSPARDDLVVYLPLWERSGSQVLSHTKNIKYGTIYGTTYADDPPFFGGSLVTP